MRQLLCLNCRQLISMDEMKLVRRRGQEFWVCKEKCRVANRT